MKQLSRLVLGAILLVSCQADPLDQSKPETPETEETVMTPTPLPTLVESPLGLTLSFTAQVNNSPGKTAEVRLDEQRVGTLDASGKLSVSTDSAPRYLYSAQAALLPFPPTTDQSPRCSLDQVTVSDPQAQVGRVDKLLLWEEKISGQLRPLLSPALPVPAVERIAYGQNNQTETVTALVYADRDVLLRGQRTCRGTLWPFEPSGPPYQQAAAVHVQLRQGWNDVQFVTTFRQEQVVVGGSTKTEYRTTLSVSGTKTPLPWKYNGVSLSAPVP